MKEAYVLGLQLQHEEQASGLAHIQCLQRCSPMIKAGGCNLCTLPLACFRSLVCPRKELVQSSGAPIFATAIKEKLLGHPRLVANGICTFSTIGMSIFAYFEAAA